MLKKLTSRKFAIAVLMIFILIFISDENTITEICTALVSSIYMLSEAIVDRSRAVRREVKDTANVTKYFSEDKDNENQ